MNDAQIHALAVSIEDGEWFDDTQDMLKFARMFRNQVLEEAALKSVASLPNHPDLGEVCAGQIRGMKK